MRLVANKFLVIGFKSCVGYPTNDAFVQICAEEGASTKILGIPGRRCNIL